MPFRPILNQVSLEIKKKRITCLIGESGAGKSILAKTLCALLPLDFQVSGGTITYENQRVSYDDLKKMRGRHIFYTPQDAAASLNPVIKIRKQIAESSKLDESQLPDILANLGISEPRRVLDSYPFELSGGENQRCLLAMAIAAKPRVLILDEPTSALDSHRQEEFMQLLNKARHRYDLTVMLITHNLALAAAADYMYIMLNGEIIEHGTAPALFAYPNHDYTRELIQYFFGNLNASGRSEPF